MARTGFYKKERNLPKNPWKTEIKERFDHLFQIDYYIMELTQKSP